MTQELEPADVTAARSLLSCRPGATSGEVRQAYRRALMHARPDLGPVNDSWIARAQQARDLLLALTPQDRRHQPRNEPAPRGSRTVTVPAQATAPLDLAV